MHIKYKKHTILFSLPVMCIMLILAYFALRGAVGAFIKYSESKERREVLNQELRDVEYRYNSLSKQIAYLETEKGKEEALRNKFSVAKEGENVFVIIDSNDDSIPQESQITFAQILWKNIKDFLSF